MRTLPALCLLLCYAGRLHAQNSADTAKKIPAKSNADDPASFLTRVEVFNETQYYDKTDIYLNQTVLRTILKIGKRFTTRIDLPYVYNSLETADGKRQSGIGDISFRLLGYKLRERKLSVFTASIEIQLNTAQSPLIGSGKNTLIPVISYTQVIPKKRLLLAAVLQQANSISGEEDRATISFTKLQLVGVRTWSPKLWTVLAPEWYLDYVKGGLSMNLRSRMTYAPIPRINLWLTPSVGVFGNFVGRYQWSMDIGSRFFIFSGMPVSKKQ